MKKKILISDKLAQEGIELLQKHSDFEVINKPGLSPEGLLVEIADAYGLIIRSATMVTDDVIRSADRLQVIARAGVGLDNVDIERATEKGIVVMNTPGGNTISTAEHAIALMFSIARRVPLADSSMKRGAWEKKLFRGTELRGKTVGVIGLGRIGLEVAKRCKGLSMRVVGYDPYMSSDKLSDYDIEAKEPDEIWKEADFITVHTPLTDQTRDMVTRREIEMMKPTVRLINCARGGIYNENDLYEALKERRIAGAALDVFTEEPPKTLKPFHELDNVILTPHLGASTDEAQVSVAIEAAENVAEFLLTGIARNSVNFPSLDINEYNFLKPYIELIERMGSFQGSVMNGKVEEVNIYYSGDFQNSNIAPLTSAYIKGMMSPYIDFNINFVNASVIAKERGIKIQIGEDTTSRDYSHLIRVKVVGQEGVNELWGTILARNVRFVRFDDYLVDFVPSGRMLVLHNNDVPNVIGSIGTFLGDNGINIANLHLSRAKKGGRALVIVGVDDELNPELLDKMKGLPEIIDLKYINLCIG
ncbi:MAG: phosphoglycerate dehydrogenase [Spirochaetota bacterium]|nr:phosphoglycerate dehydrogenase [Spirochaetota bacterium]